MAHNDRRVEEFFDVINRRDLGRFEGLLAEHAEFYFPKTKPLRGRARILRFFTILFRQYPKLAFDIQRRIVEGDTAAVQWKNHGLNRRNEPYENEGVTILEMEEAGVVFISDFFKDTSKF